MLTTPRALLLGVFLIASVDQALEGGRERRLEALAPDEELALEAQLLDRLHDVVREDNVHQRSSGWRARLSLDRMR